MMKLSIRLVASFASVLTLAGIASAQPTAPTKAPASVAAQPPAAPAKPAEQPKGDSGDHAKKDQPKPEEKPASPAGQETKPVANTEYVKMSTSKGDIYLELDRAKAPISVDNFLKYVDSKFYDGTIFHRVIDGFMIQGGGFTPDMKEKGNKEKAIKNEWQNGLKNKRGTIAMARTSVADSATSQFFINVVDNAALDLPRDGAAYAVFGKVIAGTDVVDKIKAVKTTTKGGHENVPVEAVTINSVTRVSEADAKKAAEGK